MQALNQKDSAKIESMDLDHTQCIPRVHSTALDDWTGRKEYDPYLNRMRIKLQVIKGHVLLSPTARDISVTGNRYHSPWFCYFFAVCKYFQCRALR